MPWQVKHLEMPVAEVDNVAFVEVARQRRRRHDVLVRLEPLIGPGGKGFRAHETAHRGVVAGRVLQDAGLERVAEPDLEFVGAAHMVEMAVGGDRG